MSQTYGRRGEVEETGRRRESENKKREGRMIMFYLNILIKH